VKKCLCDFCVRENGVTVFLARAYPRPQLATSEYGHWWACPNCARLITEKDPVALRLRAAHFWKRHETPEERYQRAEDIRSRHERFWLTRVELRWPEGKV
jgi:hypothetical protein